MSTPGARSTTARRCRQQEARDPIAARSHCLRQEAAADGGCLRFVDRAVAAERRTVGGKALHNVTAVAVAAAYLPASTRPRRPRRVLSARSLRNRAFARIPDDSVVFNKAVCLENLGRLNEALGIYRRCIEQNDFKACINAANCLRRLGKHNSAVEFALRRLSWSPIMRTVGPHSAMPNMPSAFFPEAIVAYRRAVTISPTETTPHTIWDLPGRRLAIVKEQPGL